jgi:hypothetical protein
LILESWTRVFDPATFPTTFADETQRWWVDEASGDDEGWRWRAYRNATHPSFWVAPAHPTMKRFLGGRPGNPYQKDDGHAPRAGAGAQFRLRVEFDIIDMPWGEQAWEVAR